MDTTTGTAQTLDFDGPVTERGPGWVVRDGGTVTLMGRTFTVQIQTFTYEGRATRSEIRLTGPRGAVYFLRGYLGPDSGHRQIIAYNGGNPWRLKGHEIRAFLVGDVIDAYALR